MLKLSRLAMASLGVALAVLAGPARAAAIKVMSSGGLTAAIQAVKADYETASGNTVEIVLGPSMGTSPEAIPYRLAHGQYADVVLMVGWALDDLARTGAVVPDSRTAIGESRIGMAVKAGAAKPDIGTVDAFRRALLAARSVAYSDSASGVYVEREMYDRLGIAAELKPKSRMIVAEPVGKVVAGGDAEIGFQQVSELLPVAGIVLVGPIPDAVQRVTVFSAAIPASAREPDAGRDLIAYLGSEKVRSTLVATGIDPIGAGR